jgi:hypothetical protein
VKGNWNKRREFASRDIKEVQHDEFMNFLKQRQLLLQPPAVRESEPIVNSEVLVLK